MTSAVATTTVPTRIRHPSSERVDRARKRRDGRPPISWRSFAPPRRERRSDIPRHRGSRAALGRTGEFGARPRPAALGEDDFDHHPCDPRGGGPVVSTSTKPEVMRVTAAARARSGENLLYDPSGTVECPKGISPLVWSPLSACSTWDEALLVANLMTVASTGGTSMARSFASSTDDHWHRRSEALLGVMVYRPML